ncbi:Uncharacterised protein [Leminorella richardii]|uniref:Uncharacterized protein n=1 Tax=Leminorella richardii TaxID=158841 RepID=A0A2X4XE41_9GAMM|nr:hypothetical protein [Leminorella richardii]SQI34904.1 Uncharacterised protein [Leminorella richardii]
MWARIEENEVTELTDINPEGRFHPSLQWVPCGSDVKPGYVFNDGEFQQPPTEQE